jgi:hypothetical protein
MYKYTVNNSKNNIMFSNLLIKLLYYKDIHFIDCKKVII